MKYSTLLHKSKYGYSISVPSLPGCHSQGRTRYQALANIKDAILTYLTVEQKELRNAGLTDQEFKELI